MAQGACPPRDGVSRRTRVHRSRGSISQAPRPSVTLAASPCSLARVSLPAPCIRANWFLTSAPSVELPTAEASWGMKAGKMDSFINHNPTSAVSCVSVTPNFDNCCCLLHYYIVARYDILPITQEHEWIPTSHGRVPEGRRPVDGGYEESGHRLYHAVAVVHGCSVPGKTGAHLGAIYPSPLPFSVSSSAVCSPTPCYLCVLGGANVAFGGSEIIVTEGYWIL
jgi:DM9 repeat